MITLSNVNTNDTPLLGLYYVIDMKKNTSDKTRKWKNSLEFCDIFLDEKMQMVDKETFGCFLTKVQ